MFCSGAYQQPHRTSAAARPRVCNAGDSHTCVLTELGAVWAWGTYRDASGVMGFSKHTRIQVGLRFTPALLLYTRLRG